MKFNAEPNLLVKFAKPVGHIKLISFNDDGEYETENEQIIKKLEPHFSKTEVLTELYSCKKCNFTSDKLGQLRYHYRSHKEETHESSIN